LDLPILGFPEIKHIFSIDFPSSPISGAFPSGKQPPKHHRAKRLRDGTVRHQGLERLPAIAVAGADHGRTQRGQPQAKANMVLCQGQENHGKSLVNMV